VSKSQRREREKQELREQILDAARHLLASHGCEGVTIRRIAEAIEYAPTTIYLYFEDKNALIRELCRMDSSSFTCQLESIARVNDPIECLRQTGLAYVEFGVTHPNLYRLMFSNSPDENKESATAATNPEQDFYGLLEKAIGTCMTQGLFRDDLDDVSEIAQMFWAAIHGLVSLHLAKGNENWVTWLPTRHLAEKLIDLHIRGLLRDSGLRAMFHVA
jgi:AcrR family transcriptional regulator